MKSHSKTLLLFLVFSALSCKTVTKSDANLASKSNTAWVLECRDTKGGATPSYFSWEFSRKPLQRDTKRTAGKIFPLKTLTERNYLKFAPDMRERFPFGSSDIDFIDPSKQAEDGENQDSMKMTMGKQYGPTYEIEMPINLIWKFDSKDLIDTSTLDSGLNTSVTLKKTALDPRSEGLKTYQRTLKYCKAFTPGQDYQSPYP
jgi:hypothetical protein